MERVDMKPITLSGIFCASLFVGTFATPTLLTGTVAHAAQPYWCVCNGEKKRFLASTRHCEHQNNVKQCSQRQYNAVYSRACKEMGCRLPRQRDSL
jgi:hypothetical protein